MDEQLLKSVFEKQLHIIKGFAADGEVGNYSKAYETHKRFIRNIACSAREELHRRREAKSVKVLDIGCGDGVLLMYLYHHAPAANARFFGVDITGPDIRLADECRRFMGIAGDRMAFSCGNAESLAFGNDEFDVVICSEVLEHLPDPLAGLREICRVLKPGGRAVISTPNERNPLVTLRRKLKRRPAEAPRAADEWYSPYPGHISVMSVPELCRKTGEAGLKVIAKKRGSILWGGPRYNAHPLLFSGMIVLDLLLDHLPFTTSFTENLTLILAKR